MYHSRSRIILHLCFAAFMASACQAAVGEEGAFSDDGYPLDGLDVAVDAGDACDETDCPQSAYAAAIPKKGGDDGKGAKDDGKGGKDDGKGAKDDGKGGKKQDVSPATAADAAQSCAAAGTSAGGWWLCTLGLTLLRRRRAAA